MKVQLKGYIKYVNKENARVSCRIPDRNNDDQRVIIVAGTRKIACDLFETKYRHYIDEDIGWSIDLIPTSKQGIINLC